MSGIIQILELLGIFLFLLYYGLSCIGDFLKISNIFSVLIKAINITIYQYIWTLSMCNYSFWTSMMIHCVRYEEKWWCYIMILPSSDIAIMPYLYYIGSFYCLTLDITLFGIFPPSIFSFKRLSGEGNFQFQFLIFIVSFHWHCHCIPSISCTSHETQLFGIN